MEVANELRLLASGQDSTGGCGTVTGTATIATTTASTTAVEVKEHHSGSDAEVKKGDLTKTEVKTCNSDAASEVKTEGVKVKESETEVKTDSDTVVVLDLTADDKKAVEKTTSNKRQKITSFFTKTA